MLSMIALMIGILIGGFSVYMIIRFIPSDEEFKWPEMKDRGL